MQDAIQRRVVRQFRHRDHRQLAAHDVALERVVVGEHQGIEADIQALGDLAEIGRLVGPVGDEAGDVRRAAAPSPGACRTARARSPRRSSSTRPGSRRAATGRAHSAGRRRKASPSALPWPSTMPSSPSSPITPPQSVLSRSSTRHLKERPCCAASSRATRSPYICAAAGCISCLARCHSAGSCQAGSRLGRAVVQRQQIRAFSVGQFAHSLVEASDDRAREPGRRCSLLPKSAGNSGSAVCCTILQPNASRASRRCRQSRRRAGQSFRSTASASSAGSKPASRW